MDALDPPQLKIVPPPVPIRKPATMVTQEDLERVVHVQNALFELREIHQGKMALLRRRLEAGAKVERGNHIVRLYRRSGRLLVR